MKIENVPIEKLTSDPGNVRKHGERNAASIRTSLERFGQQKPIVVDENNVVIAGNGTFEEARNLGWKKIAVVRTKLQGDERIAYAVADNRTGELSEWNESSLAELLGHYKDTDVLDSMGFTEEEFGELLESVALSDDLEHFEEMGEGADSADGDSGGKKSGKTDIQSTDISITITGPRETMLKIREHINETRKAGLADSIADALLLLIARKEVEA